MCNTCCNFDEWESCETQLKVQLLSPFSSFNFVLPFSLCLSLSLSLFSSIETFSPSFDWEFPFFSFFSFSHSLIGNFFSFFFLLPRVRFMVSQDFGWQSKGEDHFRSWFPFFFVYLVTTMYCSDVIWSKDLSAYFSCFFSSDVWSGIFFPLLSSDFLIGNFLLFSFSSFLFSFEGKVGHSHPGSRFMVSWDFGSRLVERLVMIYVRVWSAVRG